MKEQDYQKQLDSEEASQQAGFRKFQKQTEQNNKIGNGSNNDFGLFVKKVLLADVVRNLEKRASQIVGHNASEVNHILRKCLKATPDARATDFFDPEEAAFLGLQLTLDTALNPNKLASKEPSKNGGDKKLLQKKTLNQLNHQIGKVVHQQICLRYIKETFPGWFRKANKEAEKANADGVKATTSYWEFRIEKAMRDFGNYLREQGNHRDADFMDNRKCWTYRECSVVGALVFHSVLVGCGDYIEIVDGIRMDDRTRKPRKVKEVMLTPLGKQQETRIRDYVAAYAHDILPMVVEPNPVTNDKLGGWLGDTLQLLEDQLLQKLQSLIFHQTYNPHIIAKSNELQQSN